MICYQGTAIERNSVHQNEFLVIDKFQKNHTHLLFMTPADLHRKRVPRVILKAQTCSCIFTTWNDGCVAKFAHPPTSRSSLGGAPTLGKTWRKHGDNLALPAPRSNRAGLAHVEQPQLLFVLPLGFASELFYAIEGDLLCHNE